MIFNIWMFEDTYKGNKFSNVYDLNKIKRKHSRISSLNYIFISNDALKLVVFIYSLHLIPHTVISLRQVP